LGLACTLAPDTPYAVVESGAESPRGLRLWGGINLGDEATGVVLIDVAWREMADEVRRSFPDDAAAAAVTTVGALSERFLRARPDVPPVRLTLWPGEGFRLSRDGAILDGFTEDKQEPNVLLLITEVGDAAREGPVP
jgi:hypothetical protein